MAPSAKAMATNKEYTPEQVHHHLLALVDMNESSWAPTCPFCDKTLKSLDSFSGEWKRQHQSLNMHAWNCEQVYHVEGLLFFDEGGDDSTKKKKKAAAPVKSLLVPKPKAAVQMPDLLSQEEMVEQVITDVHATDTVADLCRIIEACTTRIAAISAASSSSGDGGGKKRRRGR